MAGEANTSTRVVSGTTARDGPASQAVGRVGARLVTGGSNPAAVSTRTACGGRETACPSARRIVTRNPRHGGTD